MSDPAAYDVPEYLVRHANRFCQNLVRVNSLLDLHDFALEIMQKRLAADPEFDNSRSPDVGDILRSATVLLHACLEDFLRTIASAYAESGFRLAREYPSSRNGHFPPDQIHAERSRQALRKERCYGNR